jgi:hypothetical protein
VLIDKASFRARLGNLGERTFDSLLARGIVPPPLELCPRVPRWTEQDVELTVSRLPRREKRQEPETLATGRRKRIEQLKGGQ